KGRKGMIIVCVLFVLAGAAILVYRQSGSSAPGSPYPGVYKSAVVKGGETRSDLRAELRRIPDLSGEVQAVLREGQPVRALEISGNDRNTRNAASADTRWVWVITNDAQKISGWIPESRLVYY
ncbi:MAG: hypothetical protein FWF29_03405, partial [Treponema sp.]|nr:hypothetical protein [Treponema sp.]